MSGNRAWEFRIGRFRFRPTLVPTLITIPAVAVMLGLGAWQVERLEWKQELIASRTARFAAPPIALPQAPAEPAEFEFHRVRVTGTYLHEREMYLPARTLNGNLGWHVITPLMRDEGSHVLIDRGWVPLKRKEPESRALGQVPGRVTVEGVLRTAGRKGWFVPDNQPDENAWFYVDLDAMAAHAGLGSVSPYYVEAGPAEVPGGLPIGGQTRIRLRNEHLSYAITWYALALALVVIYLLYHRVKED
jgi:surfeit locus 1 family protein